MTNTSEGTSSSSGAALMLFQGTLTFQFTTAVTGSQTVTLEFKKNGKVVFSDQRANISFLSSSPNGPGCAPVCQQATVSL